VVVAPFLPLIFSSVFFSQQKGRAVGGCGKPALWFSKRLVGAFCASTGAAPSTASVLVLGRVIA
jgi:hypothetical protein